MGNLTSAETMQRLEEARQKQRDHEETRRREIMEENQNIQQRLEEARERQRVYEENRRRELSQPNCQK